MDSMKNSEQLDFDEDFSLEGLSETEISLFLNSLINLVDFYGSVFDKEFLLENISDSEVTSLKLYFEKILDIFIEWEVTEYVEVIYVILAKIGLRLKDF